MLGRKRPLICRLLLPRKAYPYLILAIALYRFMTLSGLQRLREQVRLMKTLLAIDFVQVYAFLNDLLW